MNRYFSRRFIRRSLSIVTAAAAVASTGLMLNGGPAGAAFAGEPFATAFEIDGNTRVDDLVDGQDWESDPATATNLNGAPFRTDEVCSAQSVPDPDNPGETISVDSTILTPGSKIDDILVDNPPVQAGSILTKGDICSVWQASEIVQVGSEYEFIFYGAWTRPDVNGEINILYPLLGEDTTTNDDDILISYDFEDNTDQTTVTVLNWDGNSWEPTPPPAEAFEAITTRGADQTQVDLEDFTFGEFAINLTATDILPQDGPCTTFSAGDPMSRTGNSQSATLKDIVGVEPLTLTNCSAITVIKETAPANPAGFPTFTATVNQLDGQDVIFGEDVVTLDLVVPTTATQTIEDVLISPDYVVTETDLPDGWTQTSLVCETYDPIAGEELTLTLFGPDVVVPSFSVAPGHTAVCTIKNVGPPTVTVDKITVGGVGGPFEFSVVQGEDSSPLSVTTTEAGVATPAGSVIVEPGSVTVTETDVPAGFFADDLECVLTDAEGLFGAVIGADVNGVPVGVTASVAQGGSLHCTQTNLAAGSVDVTKTVAGISTDWAFDFTISPVPAGEVATKTATATDATVSWGNLQPGVVYTVTEQAEDGYISGTVVCDEGASFTAAPGVTSTCAVTNTELADVDVTKTVAGTSTDWSFDFTISPVPAGETGTKSATNADPTVGWAGLVPGVAYTITEDAVDGYISGSVVCDTDATFTPTPGSSTSCAVTNTELADVDITKTVAGSDADWSFDFTISPVPAGETATKAATNADPTVGWAGLVPGVAYTITESATGGFSPGNLVCGGTDSVGSSTFTPAPGSSTSCAITNTGFGSANITKTVPGETGWSFNFTISPVPAGETATKTTTSAAPTVTWNNLTPGVDYTISEVISSDLVVGTMSCTNGINAVGSSTFQVSAGSTATCSISNTRLTDIQVTKTAGGPVVLAGGVIDWTIVVKNNGPSTALDVVLTDQLPSTLVLTGVVAPPSWNCGGSTNGLGGKVVCTTPELIPGEAAIITVRSIAADGLANVTIENVAVVTTTTTETTMTNNTDQDVVVVPPLAVLPPTGGVFGMQVEMAVLLLLGGIGAMGIAHRRRRIMI